MKLARTEEGASYRLVIVDIDDGIRTPLYNPGTPPPKYGASAQQSYVPETVGEELELVDTDRVIMSRQNGCIKGFEDAGYIEVTEEPVSP